MEKTELFKLLQSTSKPELLAVDVDGWGTVYVKQLTISAVEKQAKQGADGENVVARNIALSMCDKDGNQFLDPDDKEHMDLLSSQSWERIKPIRDAMEKINAPKA